MGYSAVEAVFFMVIFSTLDEFVSKFSVRCVKPRRSTHAPHLCHQLCLRQLDLRGLRGRQIALGPRPIRA